MKLVCACIGDEGVGDYNFAMINMSKTYIKWLCESLTAVKLLKKGQASFFDIEYFDYQVQYYTTLPPSPLSEDPLGLGSQFVRVADDFVSDQEPLPAAARTVGIMIDSVIWRGHPKHSGGQFETPTMQERFLRGLREEN